MHARNICILILLLALLAGCNLGSSRDAATLGPAPTLTPGQTPTAAPSATPLVCTPRTDWLAYTVVAGDTLSDLAARTGTTVTALIDGNCLENPDTLIIGQVMRVPQTPVAAGQTPTAERGDECLEDFYINTGTDFLTLSPFLSFDGTCYGLQAGALVTVRWPGAPAGLTEVTFYRNQPQLSRADVIGIDNTPADGFSVLWLASPGTPPSVLYAFGVGPGQGSQVDSDAVGIYVIEN